MSKSIYYPDEIDEIIKLAMLDEINTIINDWDAVPAEEKITTINGMYVLASAINQHIAGSGEKKEEK